MIGGQQGGAPVVVDARGPRHQRLRVAARALRSQAAQGRYKVAHQAGMLEADTVEELFAAVHSDPMRVGPPVDAIVAWTEKAIAAEQRRRARLDSTADGFTAPDAPMNLHLEWRGGVIDQAQSHILTPEPVQVRDYGDPVPMVAAPAVKGNRRPESSRSPFDTSATPYEIAREAANTGKPVEQVVEELGARDVGQLEAAQVEAE